MSETKGSTLIHGCDIISKRLRYCLSPQGWLYKFDQNRPKPLPLLIVLMHLLSPLLILIVELILNQLLYEVEKESDEYRAIQQSTFIIRLVKTVRIFRQISYIAIILIILAQHSSMANVIASSNNFVSEKEQLHFARMSFAIFLIKSIARVSSFLSIASFQLMRSELNLQDLLCILASVALFLSSINHSATLIYTCYLGASLGKHVENFSKIYVDTMFDQFMKAIEKEGEGLSASNPVRLAFFDTNSDTSAEELNQERTGCMSKCCHGCFGYIGLVWRFIIRALVSVFTFLRDIFARLNARKYPELPEMKMTKLSSTTNIQISETMRMANSHLIRVRLRRTQIMLSELRDIVSDINKTSSPIVLMYLAYETVMLIFITTASIQAKVYKSIDLLIVPTVSATISLVASVVYICTCLDETTKQLKLLINKLFDFIIMNHRVQSTGKRALGTVPQAHTSDSDVCIIPGSETGAINETWSQFQYTRKLANTIHFTMGGIFPVSRRLVLSILGHILSAVFISIEIMSIIDTQNTSHGASGGHPSSHNNLNSHSNATTQYDLKDLHLTH